MSIKYKGQTVANVGGSDGVTMDQVNTAIQDAVAGIQPQEVYSTEETRIGTWIDGKPLYRMVFELPGSTLSKVTYSQSNVVNVPISGTKNYDIMIINARGHVNSLDDSKTISYLNVQTPGGYSYSVTVDYVYTGQNMFSLSFKGYASSASGSNGTVYVIVEYTKTTDEATS